MKTQLKLMASMLFLIALLLLFVSLNSFTMALDYSESVDDWQQIMLFEAVLTLLFGAGWLLQHFAEHFALNNRRNLALLVCLIPMAAQFLVSQFKIPASFLGFALTASTFVTLFGQFLRLLSTFTHPDRLDKLSKALGLDLEL
jgi:hypothetical protein